MELSALISPVSLDQFVAEYFEKLPLHIMREDSGYYSGLLTLNDLDSVLARHLLRQADCRVTKQIKMVPPREFLSTSSKGMEDVVDPTKIHALIREGATIIFEAAHRWHPPLNKLTNTIYREWGHHSQCNVYLTPPGSYGFGPHYDTHDVIILQVHGSKRWKLYDNRIELALQSQAKTVTALADEPSHELVLQQGDALYIPRGLVHDAETLDDTSAHITLGLLFYTWNEFLSDTINRAAHDNVALRKALPLGFLGKNPLSTVNRQFLDGMVAAVRAQLELDLANSAVPEGYASRAVPLHQKGLLLSAVSEDVLTLDTKVEVREGKNFRVVNGEDSVILEGTGVQLSFPADVAEVITFVLDSSTFVVNDIPELDDESKLILAKRLIKEGCLAVAAR